MTLISCVKCDRSAAGLAEGWFDPNQVDSVALAAVNQTSVGSIYCRPACVTSAAREEETFQWERLGTMFQIFLPLLVLYWPIYSH